MKNQQNYEFFPDENMKTRLIVKNSIWIIFVILLVTNFFIFVSGIKIGDEINYFEKETRVFHQQNVELEKQKSSLSSLQYAASIAATLDFTKKSQPIYLDNLPYAMNK